MAELPEREWLLGMAADPFLVRVLRAAGVFGVESQAPCCDPQSVGLARVQKLPS